MAWRFYFCDLDQAKMVIARGGYYLLAAASVAAVWSALPPLRGAGLKAMWVGAKRHRLAVFVILWGALFLHLHEPHLFKVTQDEPVHLLTSQVMHLEKTAQLAGQAHYVGDVFVLSGFYPSFRVNLFSFYVSLLHDLTGYRVANVFVLNGLLTPLLLWITWGVGRRLGGELAGCFAAVGMACFPLLGQVVTSGSYDVLNLVLLVGAIWATLNYVRADADSRMAWMNFSLSLVVLLSLSRNESIAYIAVWMGCVAYVWWRERTVRVSWFGVFSPVLLLPNLAANYITFATERLLYAPIKGNSEPFFSFAHVPGHLEDLVYYLFAEGNRYTNNPLVALAGVVGFVFLTVVMRRRDTVGREQLGIFAVWGLFIAGLYGVVLAQFWSSPLDDAAARFVLPLWWVLALSGGWWVAQLPGIKSRRVWVLVALFVGQLYVVAPVGSLAYATYSLVGARADAWLVDQASGYKRTETLFVSSACSSLIAHRFAAVPMEKLEKPARFVRALKARLYERVLVCQYFTLSKSGRWVAMVGSELPESISLSMQSERVLAGSLMVRISRFDGYRGTNGSLIDTESEIPDVALVKHFRSSDEAIQYRRSLYP